MNMLTEEIRRIREENKLLRDALAQAADSFNDDANVTTSAKERGFYIKMRDWFNRLLEETEK